MTSRERVKRSIHFQGVDHIPHYLFDGGADDILWLWPPRAPDIQPWTPGADGIERRIDGAGATWERLIGDTIHGEKTKVPVGDIRLQADYRLADHNHPSHFIDARRAVEENNASANPKYCLAVAPFSGLNEPLQELVGLDRLFESYYEEPGHVKALIGRLAEAQRESFRLLAGCGCDGVMIYDDWGLQDRLMISLPMIREFFGPHYRANWEYAHSLGMDTWMHSCGYIIELLPALREWGLDVIQQDQQENMGLEALDAVAGGRLAFWCPVDIQKTMADGSVDDIRAYVRRMMATLGNHAGGLISKRYPDAKAVGHSDEKNTAMCAAFRELGVYPQP